MFPGFLKCGFLYVSKMRFTVKQMFIPNVIILFFYDFFSPEKRLLFITISLAICVKCLLKSFGPCLIVFYIIIKL